MPEFNQGSSSPGDGEGHGEGAASPRFLRPCGGAASSFSLAGEMNP